MEPAITQHFVLIVDFGGQYSHLIVRRIRELGVFSEMVPWSQAPEVIQQRRPDAVILSGGPSSVIDPNAPHLDLTLIEGIPTLGICYGLQWIAKYFGGHISKAKVREYGLSKLLHREPGSLVESLENPTVWMSHGDQIIDLPSGFKATASTSTCHVAAFEYSEKKLYGVQFHPEVSHTPQGIELLSKFLFDKAGLKSDWTNKNFIESSIQQIRETVDNEHVLCAVSGGVDSAVVAALLSEAIGEQLTCVFVDHGLLRKNEAEEVIETFTEHFKPKLIVIDAKEQFFFALRGVTDPEEKRKIIGEEFVRVFEEHAQEISDCTFLAQGTLYPDIIESGSSTAVKIKAHHNVGGLPSWMRMKVIEPLRWLFKDEVREVGRQLGLPETIVDREPFPGPGLAIRIIGEVTPEKVKIVQEADWIFRSELRAHNLHREIWQSYAALLDIRSVGVMGDERTYEHPIVLRAVKSEDAMTAHAVSFPPEVLNHIATRIVNEVKGVNRVLYDLTSKPPATIEWE
jgi:GMP synthase (glutamine-hydrolysing)